MTQDELREEHPALYGGARLYGRLSQTLFLIFLVLKLVGVIAWSWWLVFLPLIVGLGIPLMILGIIFYVDQNQ